MKRITSTWKSAVLAAATLAALGFGAAQAFAAPAPKAAPAERACSTWSCPECGSLGGQWIPMYGKCLCCG